MLLVPNETGEIVRAVDYFNTVRPLHLPHLFLLNMALGSFLTGLGRWRYTPVRSYGISRRSTAAQVSPTSRWQAVRIADRESGADGPSCSLTTSTGTSRLRVWA